MRRTLVLIFILIVAACSGDDPSVNGSAPASPEDRTYYAVLAGTGGTSGRLYVTSGGDSIPELLASTTVQDASGVLHIAGPGDFDIAGTITVPSGPVTLSGGGYTLSGTDSDFITGTWKGPAGTGSFSGVKDLGSTLLYCGRYEGDDSGVFNLVRSDQKFFGSFYGNLMNGDIRGSVKIDLRTFDPYISLTFSGGGTAVSYSPVSSPSLGGTWTRGEMHGTWNVSTGCP